MVVEPLHLQEQGAQRGGPGGDLRAGQRLDGLAVGHGVGEGAGPADPLGDLEHLVEPLPFGQLLQPAVAVEEARLQVEDHLANRGKAEVPRLDDPGVDRPDRNLHDPLAVQVVEAVRRAGHAGHGHGGIEVLAQGVYALRPVVVQHQPAGVGMALGHQPQQVLGPPARTSGRRAGKGVTEGNCGRAGSTSASTLTQ